ncbi:DUF3134 family protein [Thermostichus vulcanus]|uniref:DUF3134 family protein n=1 Tax=Thermostichus vulcanus str. 'Rupite' TaxID=2813851 RepID=A0ABT0C698_THEVL|nr:DUF3134 family protein [Thermostichus vulcanus]MCJ2541306.1 DUF3134 family protein [Thermostichus vulcanus str. 'Rupite']
MYNPSLREEPRDQPPTVVPSPSSLSIIDWLRQEGRLIEHPIEVTGLVLEEDIDDIDDLIGDDYGDDFDSDDE